MCVWMYVCHPNQADSLTLLNHPSPIPVEEVLMGSLDGIRLDRQTDLLAAAQPRKDDNAYLVYLIRMLRQTEDRLDSSYQNDGLVR